MQMQHLKLEVLVSMVLSNEAVTRSTAGDVVERSYVDQLETDWDVGPEA